MLDFEMTFDTPLTDPLNAFRQLKIVVHGVESDCATVLSFAVLLKINDISTVT